MLSAIFHAKLLRYFPRFTPSSSVGRPPRFPHHFQIHPSHSTPPARSQRLHRRLFCRKPPAYRSYLFLNCSQYSRSFGVINPSQKHFAIALDRPWMRSTSAMSRHSNDQDASSASAFGLAADSDYTGRVVAPTKTLRQTQGPQTPLGRTDILVCLFHPIQL